MSGPYESLPFSRGATYGATSDDAGSHLEGREYIVPDLHYGTGKLVKLRVCRNDSGATLAGKRLAKFDVTTAGVTESSVIGYATVTAERAYVIDDRLPSAGVPDGDLFYVVVEGPALAKTGLAGDATNVISAQAYLHALTAVTTGATTAGRVAAAAFTGATAVLAGQIQNVIGVALTARTTGNTDADILVDVRRF